jgi:hypothetical protein
VLLCNFNNGNPDVMLNFVMELRSLLQSAK